MRILIAALLFASAPLAQEETKTQPQKAVSEASEPKAAEEAKTEAAPKAAEPTRRKIQYGIQRHRLRRTGYVNKPIRNFDYTGIHYPPRHGYGTNLSINRPHRSYDYYNAHRGVRSDWAAYSGRYGLPRYFQSGARYFAPRFTYRGFRSYRGYRSMRYFPGAYWR